LPNERGNFFICNVKTKNVAQGRAPPHLIQGLKYVRKVSFFWAGFISSKERKAALKKIKI